MAYDARTTTYDARLRSMDNAVINLKIQSQSLRARSEAGPLSFFAIDEFLTELRSARAEVDSVRDDTGFKAWALDQRGGDATKLAADYNAMRTAIIDTIDWIVANLPKSGPYVLVLSYASDGTKTGREFGTPELANFRTRLTALEATINIG